MVRARYTNKESLVARVRRALSQHAGDELGSESTGCVRSEDVDALQARLLLLQRDYPAVAAHVGLSEDLLDVTASQTGATVRGVLTIKG